MATTTFLPNNVAASRIQGLIRECKHVDVAVAWATVNAVSNALLAQRLRRIGKLIVGTSFYHTDPKLLERLIGVQQARCMPPTGDLFHPKVYLFTLPKGRAVVVGSHNLTRHAFTSNTEASLLIEGAPEDPLFKELDRFIALAWKQAKPIKREFVDCYRANREANQKHCEALERFVVPPPRLPVQWSELVSAVKNDRYGKDGIRLEVLAKAQLQFATYTSFAAMPQEIRRELAGMVYESSWGLFGSMSGHGEFQSRVNRFPDGISAAIERIPLTGPVTKEDFDAYVSAFQKAFAGAAHGAGLASGTRLLALKRPDVFVPVNRANAERVCSAFGVARTTTKLDNYWSRIILPLQLVPWWRAARPKKRLEAKIWDGRAALLDALYYRPLQPKKKA